MAIPASTTAPRTTEKATSVAPAHISKTVETATSVTLVQIPRTAEIIATSATTVEPAVT